MDSGREHLRSQTIEKSAFISVHQRPNQLWNLKSKDNSLPLNLRFLEIDQQTKSPPRSAQIVKTLCNVLIREPFNALQLDNEHIVHKNIGIVQADTMAL